MVRGLSAGFGLLLTAFLLAACSPSSEVAEKEPGPYELTFPLGLDAESAIIPEDNPVTEEKLKLGKRLFFETSISVDHSISCASCHVPENGFADPNQFSSGVEGKKGGRQSPPAFNRIFTLRQFWDGRAATLEEQALGPLQNPIEMAMPDMETVVKRLQEDPEYVALFKTAFPPEGGVTADHIANSIATFERSILAGNSPFDRFQAGDKSAMSESAQRGYEIFKDENRGNCETCHVGFNFSDENYYNLGVGMDAKKPDLGRYAVQKLEGYQGAFKTPTLRQITQSAPYMHDGSQRTLEEVVDFYNKGGHANKWLNSKVKKLNLSKQDQKDLVEFLKALTGEVTWYGKGKEPKMMSLRN
jgi:cytochrome c peroxidase